MDIYTFLALLLCIYVIVNFIIFKIQERFLFKPEKLPQDFEYKYSFPFEEIFFHIKKGVTINALRFFATNAKGVVLYFHGNSRSIKGWGKFSTDFTKHGFDVVMVDYRGFGKSTGRRSEIGMKNDFQRIYKKLTKMYPENQIVVYGRSLGSGFATKIASKNNPAMLILESPYYSLARLTKRILPILPIDLILRFRLRTYLWMKFVKCPIRIIHGTHDRLIAPKASRDLANIKPEQTMVYLINGGGHNNLQKFPEYHEVLGKIMQEAEEFVKKVPVIVPKEVPNEGFLQQLFMNQLGKNPSV